MPTSTGAGVPAYSAGGGTAGKMNDDGGGTTPPVALPRPTVTPGAEDDEGCKGAAAP